MTSQTTIHLHKAMFGQAEQTLLEWNGLTASLFTYPSGVLGVRLKNGVGEMTLLPFQGQQIWHLAFYGRTLTMQSMFDQPQPTQVYLQTYGGFLVHCGATAMGVPAQGDSHPVHGELPNAPYREARLLLGEDERGAYVGLTGTYQHTVAFSHNYVAQPLVKMYADSSHLRLSMRIHNLKRSPMELMYLAHVNFRPVDNGRLVYSARATPQNVRVRSSIPSHISPPPGYRKFLDQLTQNPSLHHVLKPGLAFDPEAVFFIRYLADPQGWAYSLQVHPDGSADFVYHRPQQLDHGIRWISRTPDQDCLGIVLPATAEPEGYSAEKAKGNVKLLPPGGDFFCEMETGALLPQEAGEMVGRVEEIVNGR
jgi:hypothetical protein